MKQHDKNKMNDALKKALRAISVYKKENDRMYKQLSTQEKDIRKLRLEFSETDKATRKKEKERARAMFGDPKKSILARNPMDFPGSGSAPQNSIRASFRESPASEIASDKPLAAISNAGSSRETKPTHDDDDGDDGGDDDDGTSSFLEEHIESLVIVSVLALGWFLATRMNKKR
mmetsp:Transcript_113896/g.233071  ORF Transcript_113896/g.233071 Transcript_113896/m.233071 type:complete len:174 (-) Transcript_113896:95-616(-)